MVEKRFRVLRIIGTIYKVLGWIILVIGTLTSLGIFVGGLLGGAGMTQFVGRNSQLAGLMGGVLGGLAAAVVSFVLTLVYFVFVYGMGELIYLFLAIEENTRATSAWIGRWLQAPAGVPPAPPPQY
jgi:hypothetical protein